MVSWTAYLPYSEFPMNTDWGLTPNLSLVIDTPEVGPAMARLRSRTVLLTMTATIDMTYLQYTQTFKPFIMNTLHGGIDWFEMPFLLDGIVRKTRLAIGGKAPYTIKRKDADFYSVNLTFEAMDLNGVS